jgi:hypothetical protein
MVREGYLDYARALVREGRQTPSSEEDLKLPKGFLVTCSGFSDSPLNLYAEDDVHWTEMTQPLSEHLREMLRTLDGANIIDGERISSPVVFDAAQRDARLYFNRVNSSGHPRFSRLLPFFLPQNFTYQTEGEIKAGSKTKNALAVAIVGRQNSNPVSTYLSKTTVYNSTGTGKVTGMSLGHDGVYHYDEFFLIRSDELSDPEREAVGKDMYIDRQNGRGIVAVHQSFETPVVNPSLQRTARRIVAPAELFE